MSCSELSPALFLLLEIRTRLVAILRYHTDCWQLWHAFWWLSGLVNSLASCCSSAKCRRWHDAVALLNVGAEALTIWPYRYLGNVRVLYSPRLQLAPCCCCLWYWQNRAIFLSLRAETACDTFLWSALGSFLNFDAGCVPSCGASDALMPVTAAENGNLECYYSDGPLMPEVMEHQSFRTKIHLIGVLCPYACWGH